MDVAWVRSEVWAGAPRRVGEWTATPVLLVTATLLASGTGSQGARGAAALFAEVRPLALLCHTDAGPIVNLLLKNGRGG